MKKITAVMTATAVYTNMMCENISCSPVTVSYVLYDDGSVEKVGLQNTKPSINGSAIITWPFTPEEAKVLLEAKSKGLL